MSEIVQVNPSKLGLSCTWCLYWVPFLNLISDVFTGENYMRIGREWGWGVSSFECVIDKIGMELMKSPPVPAYLK